MQIAFTSRWVNFLLEVGDSHEEVADGSVVGLSGGSFEIVPPEPAELEYDDRFGFAGGS